MRFQPAIKPLGAPGCWTVIDGSTPMWEGVSLKCGYDKHRVDPKCEGCVKNSKTSERIQVEAERQGLLPMCMLLLS